MIAALSNTRVAIASALDRHPATDYRRPTFFWEGDINVRIKNKYSARNESDLGKVLSQSVMGITHNLSNPFVPSVDTERQFIFICGCGHSGTTLLAARLGNHPETFFIARETACFSWPRGLYATSKIISEWLHFSSAAKATTIIEKTPKHVHSVKRIKRLIPKAKIVAMTRNPLDNIASLYARLDNLDAAIDRWLVDNRAVLKHRDSDSILLIRYEDLTESPQFWFREATEFGGLNWSENILNTGVTEYDLADQVPHMSKRAREVSQPIEPKVGSWRSILSEAQAHYVLAKTSTLARDLGYSDQFI